MRLESEPRFFRRPCALNRLITFISPELLRLGRNELVRRVDRDVRATQSRTCFRHPPHLMQTRGPSAAPRGRQKAGFAEPRYSDAEQENLNCARGYTTLAFTNRRIHGKS